MFEYFEIRKNSRIGEKKGWRRCCRKWKKSSNCKRAFRNNLLDNGPRLSNNNRKKKTQCLYNIFAKKKFPKFVKHTLIDMSENACNFCHNTKLGKKKTLGQKQMQIGKCTTTTFLEMSYLPSHLVIGLEWTCTFTGRLVEWWKTQKRVLVCF